MADEELRIAKPGRTPGSDFTKQDGPRIEAMRRLIDEGKASSPTEAAKMVVPNNHSRVEGWGTRQGKIRRHIDGYKRRYGG
jgi:hypothetical protein